MPVLGQVRADLSLGAESTTLSGTPTNLSVNGGAKRGQNLFHSFAEFSLSQGQKAHFSGKDVTNILSRVTGNQTSVIDGLLGVSGNANLFFLNPNGIIFGQNASLDINGAFLATTAKSIRFGQDFNFESSGNSIPQVTVNTPSHLVFDGSSRGIEINGPGASIFQSTNTLFPAVNLQPIPMGLAAKAQNSLAFVGSGINLNGGIISTSSGKTQLGSVQSGEVAISSLAPFQFSLSYEGVKAFDNILLNNQSLINGSSQIQGGGIQLDGKNIELKNFSLLFTSNDGFGNAGEISVNAREDFSVVAEDNISLPLPVGFLWRFGGILAQTIFGDGAPIKVNAQNFYLSNTGTVYSTTFGPGNAGNIDIDVENRVFLTDSETFINRGPANNVAISRTLGSGRAGRILVDADEIFLDQGSIISSVTAGQGRGGDLIIPNASAVTVTGFNPNSLLAANISAATTLAGPGENVNIKTGDLNLTNGGRIDTGTLAAGDAGNINIEAKNITISGDIPGSLLSSQIVSAAQLADPEQLALFGVMLDLTGKSGTVRIKADDISISDQALIGVNNTGTGDAGAIFVDAKTLNLFDNAIITATTENGNGGNINLNTGFLALKNSSIASSAKASGLGGNITINTQLLSASDNARIEANAENSLAGNIQLSAQNILVAPTTVITTTSASGPQLDGEVQINQSQNQIAFLNDETVDNDSTQLNLSACQSDGSSLANHGAGGYFSSVQDREIYAAGLRQRLALANRYVYADSETQEVKPFRRWLGVQKNEKSGDLELVFSPTENQQLLSLITAQNTYC